MKKVIFSLSFLLLLTACGREEKDNQIAVLQTENAAYQEQISALEAENASLRDQLEERQDAGEEADPITSFFAAVECDGSTVSMNIVAGNLFHTASHSVLCFHPNIYCYYGQCA